MINKKCRKCGEVKNFSMFHVGTSACKSCYNEHCKAYRRNLAKDEISFLIKNDIYHKHFNNSGTKRWCKKCGLIDNPILFISSSRCKPCNILAKRESTKKNRDNRTPKQIEYFKQHQKQYQSTPEYKKKAAAQSQKWRNENPIEALKRSRDQLKKHGKRYNAIRKEKYHNDPEYRAKKDAMDKIYRKSELGKAMLCKPENIENARERTRKRRQNPVLREHDYARRREYWKLYKDELLVKAKEKRKSLPDYYVKQQIRKRYKYIKVQDIPNELIQLEKEKLKLFRATR